MRGVISSILAAIVVVLALDAVAPSLGLDPAVFARPVADEKAAVQVVDRTQKGDRLRVPTAIGRRIMPPRAPLIGCDAVFSSLSVGARMNYAGRCLAERTGSALVTA